MIRSLIASACLALLTACGGGGAAEADKPTVRAMAQPQVLAEVFGDSTLVRVYVDQQASAVAYAETALGTKLIDSAVAGSDSMSVEPERMAASAGRIVVSNWAVNDSAGMTERDYEARLTAQSNAVRETGRVMLLLESTPIVPGGKWSTARDESRRAVFEQIKARVARSTGAYYCKLPARAWTLQDKPDGVHEHDAASQFKGEALARCIERADQ